MAQSLILQARHKACNDDAIHLVEQLSSLDVLGHIQSMDKGKAAQGTQA